MSFAIETHDLTKRFPGPGRLAGLPFPFSGDGERGGGTLAVDRVTVRVGQGEIFGLVGPNGAGKTTLVKMLSTLILPTAGSARVNGYALSDEGRVRGSIGLVTGNERSFYPRLTCQENLRFYAGLHNLSAAQAAWRIQELSRLLSLEEFLDKRYDTCSTGMKHRVGLARGLLNDPRLLFLDEPTRSLDPLAAARFRQAVYALAHQEGHTVFLVTHDLDEAAELCDRVGVMVRGRLRVVGAPERLRELIRPQERCCFQVRGFSPPLMGRLRALEGVLAAEQRATATSGVTRLELRLEDRKRALPVVLRVLGQGGATVKGLEFETASWEGAFQGLLDPAGDVDLEEDAPPEPGKLAPGQSDASAGESTSGAKSPAGEESGPRRPAMRRARRALRKPLLFFRRDLKTQLSYRLSFVLQFLGILFSSASFYFVAQLFGAGAAPHLGAYGGDYFSFVLIGIAFAGYQGVALYTFSSVIRSAQTMGTLEAMLVTPTRLSTILLSSSLWNFAFTSLRVVVYLLMGVAIFGVNLGRANLPAGLVILLLTILTLSGIGILSAFFIMVFKRGSPVNFLIGSLSSLLGGVYYPVEVLPPWLQALARLFPLTYSLEAMRRALLTGSSLAGLAREVAVLGLFSLALMPLGLAAFRYAVRQARRDGSLAQF